MKRNVELVVISDVHLGTYGCKAKELLRYLNSIQPKTLVLNGDIIDIWQFKKSYFPKPHLKVIRKILSFATKNTDVYYITGNHDEMFRKFTDFELGKLKVCNKICLTIDQKKPGFFTEMFSMHLSSIPNGLPNLAEKAMIFNYYQ
jgi:UDP-2,3-diacylglucosamine pyrophosphatase LpxH